jgi:hypothetical protein
MTRVKATAKTGPSRHLTIGIYLNDILLARRRALSSRAGWPGADTGSGDARQGSRSPLDR